MRVLLVTAQLLLTPLFPQHTVAEPVTITPEGSISAAAESNRELIQARTRVEEVQRGDRIIVRSRYMPHLSVTTTYDVEPSANTPSGKTEEEFGGRVE